MKSLFTTLTILLTVLSLDIMAAGNILYQEFESDMARKGISLQYSRSSLNNLNALLSDLQSKFTTKMNADIARGVESGDFDHWKESLKMMKQAKKMLSASSDTEELISNYQKAIQVLHSILAEPYEGRRNSVNEFMEMRRRKKTKLPNKLSRINSRVEDANPEASNLVSNRATGKHLSKRELKSMTYRDLSELDVRDDHPAWYNFDYIAQNSNGWKKLESWVNKRVSKRLKKKEQIDVNYDLKKARRVLFLSKMKNTSTSPKMNAKDIYGMKWKVKLGNETQVESVVNRLYMASGGKFQDLIYDNGPSDLVLVLNSKKQETSGPDCKKISSVSKLKSCFLHGKYEFESGPFILKSGTITASNIDYILKDVKDVTHTDIRKYIGRTYVMFKESSSEFTGKKIGIRGGAVSMNFSDTTSDRVYRSLAIFNLWINNTDPKDENNKIYMASKYLKGGKDFLVYQSDIGAALGERAFPGLLNTMVLGSDYISVKRSKITFKTPMTYRPLAWEKSTFADARWMARNISAIPTDKIREVVRGNNWPEFMQTALAYRLLSRRLSIAKAYGTENLLDEKHVTAPTISIDLSTREKRAAIASKYNLPLDLIEQEMRKNGLLSSGGYSTYHDMVVKRGVVSPCYETILIGLLEDYAYPSGLSRRFKRREDNIPLGRCRMGRQ